MEIRFKKLILSGFKSYLKETVIEFGAATKIEGRNGSGKSSIAEGITWLLFGTDPTGGSFDPTNIFRKLDINVTLELLDDTGEEHTLTRSVEGGKNKFKINEVPVKATEYKATVEGLFTKEEFLTLFNPNYFFSQHWTAQRQQLLQHVKDPLHADILERLPKAHSELLAAELKKLTLDKIEAKHKQMKKDTETELTKLRERIATYQELHTPAAVNTEEVAAMQNELEWIQNTLSSAMKLQEDYEKARRIYDNLANKATALYQRIQAQAAVVRDLQAADYETVCNSCGQDLTPEAKRQAEQQKVKVLMDAKAKGKLLVMEHKATIAELKALPEPKEPDNPFKLQERVYEIREALAKNRTPDYSKEIEKAQQELKRVRELNIDSSMKVDAVRMYKQEKAHYMVSSVNNLFDRISIKLFDDQKNGGQRDTFEIEYEGKPYSALSTAERIRAGLEFRETYKQLTDKDLPVAIDNFESISGGVSMTGQVMTMAVKDEELNIKQVGATS